MFFGDVFCTEQLLRGSRVVYRMFLKILYFDPKSLFCKVYRICIVANFGNFGNAVIFLTLSVSWSRFLHRTTEFFFL